MSRAPDWLTARPIAHRGLHDAAAGIIENTLPAIVAATARGFPVEMDIRLSRDGEAVVFHDETLDRLTEAAGPIAALTWAELGALPVRGSDAYIPILAEVLAHVAGRVPLVLELKPAGSDGARLVAAVARLLADYAGPAAVMSFEPAILRHARRAVSDRPLGLISYGWRDDEAAHLSPRRRFALRHMLPAAIVRPHFIAYDVGALPAPGPAILRLLGRPLLAWTVRTAEDRERAARYADQIIFEGFDPGL